MKISNTTKLAIIIVLGLFVLAALVYTSGQRPEAPTRGSEQGDSFNRADLMFMNMMIIHHDQAIRMAELAPNRTANEHVLGLAQNISAAQKRENEQMTSWLRSQGYQRPTRGHRMAGMASEAEMQRLEETEGEAFDHLFADLMIDHHEGGIQMARSEVRNGNHQELVSLAQDMVDVQTREVDLMRRWLNGGETTA